MIDFPYQQILDIDKDDSSSPNQALIASVYFLYLGMESLESKMDEVLQYLKGSIL